MRIYSISSIAIAICSIAPAFPASAQEIDGAEASDEDPIVIVGSRIPRADELVASPVLTFERDEITRYGAATVEEFINASPQVTPDFDRSSNNPGDGVASINLRGLGRSRTLILVNGRRLAPSGTGTAVDVNTIPVAMLSRVELLTGGASAIYGSDAVSGAVNFVTRQVEGIELRAQGEITGDGDGESFGVGIVAGSEFAGGRGEVTAYVDYLERASLLGAERELTRVTFGEDRVNGELIEVGAFDVPEGLILFPPAFVDGEVIFPIFEKDGSVRPGSPDDTYNFAPLNYLQVPLERLSGGAVGAYELSDRVDLFAEVMFMHSAIDSQLAPTPGRPFAPLVIDSPFFADSTRELLRAAYDRDNDGIGFALIGKRFEEVGPRRFESDITNIRTVIGGNAELDDNWDAEAFYAWNRNEKSVTFRNSISASRLSQALLVTPDGSACVDPSRGCVPANIFGAGNLSPEAVDFLRIDNFIDSSDAIQHHLSLSLTGSLLELPAGSLQASFGSEYRSNRSNLEPSELSRTGDALGFPPTNARSGSIEVTEFFAELAVPLLADGPLAERLELEGGVRWSDYSTSGSVWTWQLGGQWLPVEGLRLRLMRQRAVRAPNVEELLTQASISQTQYPATNDFCIASNNPVERGFGDVCLAQGMAPDQLGVFDLPAAAFVGADRLSIGNEALDPEQSDSLTMGASYEHRGPVRVRAGIDFFRYQIEDAISIVDDVLSLCELRPDPQSQLCGSIERNSAGLITTIIRQPLNISEAKVEGLDFTLSASAKAPQALSIGPDSRISLDVLATHYLTFGQAISPDSEFRDCAGRFGRICALTTGFDRSAASAYPDWISSTNLSYASENHVLALRWRWLGPVENFADELAAELGRPAPNLPVPKVGSKHYVDLSLRVPVADGVALQAGVANIFGTDAPILGQEAIQSNTDPSRYDIFGRRFFLTATARLGGR